MEKLGVVMDEKKVKTADGEDRCPQCGRALGQKVKSPTEDRNVLWCPHCGTEPFEKK